jgi:Interferon-related developmental regulator (IFRD)
VCPNLYLLRRAKLTKPALDLTTITLQPASVYDDASPTIKRAISDSDSRAVKTAGIYSLAMLSFFGDVADEESIDNLNFLLEIVSSDGAFIDASDEPGPVIAALESYAMLATLLDDLSSESHDAIEAFVEQLSSSNANVAIASGECIALLYEKSYSSTDSSDSDSSDSEDSSSTTSSPKTKRYEAYRHTAELESILSSLAHVSSKQMSKKDRKSMHANFADILNSVRNPGHGPRYNTAIKDDGSGEAYGSRMTVRVSRDGVMRIDRWWKFVRLQGLRRVLRDGFAAHYEGNPAIFEALPIVVEEKKGMSFKESKMRSKHFMGGTKGLLEIPT